MKNEHKQEENSSTLARLTNPDKMDSVMTVCCKDYGLESVDGCWWSAVLTFLMNNNGKQTLISCRTPYVERRVSG